MFGKKDHRAVAIIPARLGSTRFPRKALADETGKPMVVHVCEQAAKAGSVNRVVVATDAEEIKAAVETFGFEAVMTDPAHTNGSSRLSEASKILKLKDEQLIVNVQGDEPEIEPEIIDAAVLASSTDTMIDLIPGDYHDDQVAVGTVATPIRDLTQINDPNIVKVATGIILPDIGIARALTFSRSGIPYVRDNSKPVQFLRHVGIYSYTVISLNKYMSLEPTPLEQSESLEQLRWLEHGYPIAVAIRDSSHTGIDTPEQYQAFVNRYRTTQGQ